MDEEMNVPDEKDLVRSVNEYFSKISVARGKS